MKKKFIIISLSAFAVTCNSFPNILGLFTETLDIKELITEKDKLDKAENPARKYLITQELKKKDIKMTNITVKDIIPSTNIDYDFTIVSDVDTFKGKVECYIYTKNISTVSKLEKGKSIINVKGKFGRFFTILDEYYTKIEIFKSSVSIVEKKK